MADYRQVQIATYQSQFDTNDQTILGWIDSNPGSAQAEIVTGTALDERVIANVIDVLWRVHLIVQGHDENGIAVYWTAEDWVGEIKTNIGNTRTWVSNNNNGLVSDMATDLGVDFAIARQLAEAMEAEGTSKITGV